MLNKPFYDTFSFDVERISILSPRILSCLPVYFLSFKQDKQSHI